MVSVGKKRKAESSSVSESDANDIFRRYFESRFEPLADADSKVTTGDESQDDEGEDDASSAEGSNELLDEDESDWGGISDAGEEDEDSDAEEESAPVIEVVDHSSSATPKFATMSKKELKAFMSSRPPDSTAAPQEETAKTKKSSSKSLPEDAPSLLAQDLELRRLLAESHLLNPSLRGGGSPFAGGPVAPKTFAEGRTRQKAVDLRVQALGSKESILKQEKMPMSMRKGMTAAADAREAKRRKEAKENGIILERDTSSKKKRQRTGGRGLDGPGMGKFKGAELKLNKSDVIKLQNSRDVFGRRSRR